MTSDVDQSVAAEIRAQLARHRMSNRQLATKLGRSYMWVARRASGEVPATVADVHAIAGAIGIDPAELLTPTPTP